MPALLTERTLVLHVPKTGGTWIAGAMRAAGIEHATLWTRLGPGSRGHATLRDVRAHTDRFTVAFVRHPLDLLRSRWAGSVRHGWPENRLLHDVRSDDFGTFADRVVRLHPGILGRRLAEFTGPPDAPVSFVGRYESLVDDLVRALGQAGEEFDADALRAHAPQNRNDYARHRAVYDRPLALRVAAAEHAAVSRWYPQDPVPAWLLRPGSP